MTSLLLPQYKNKQMEQGVHLLLNKHADYSPTALFTMYLLTCSFFLPTLDHVATAMQLLRYMQLLPCSYFGPCSWQHHVMQRQHHIIRYCNTMLQHTPYRALYYTMQCTTVHTIEHSTPHTTVYWALQAPWSILWPSGCQSAIKIHDNQLASLICISGS